MKRALVLAGGGVAGIAWELGVLRGLQDADAGLASRVISADLVIGTSGGAVVAAQVTSGISLDDLYCAQLSETSAEIEVELDMDDLFARFSAVMVGAATPLDMQRAIGALALNTQTVPEPVRHAAVAARLPVPVWPDCAMLLTAVDAETGESIAFNKDSGVSLIDAVAASCAVPGIWPPVTINGRRYIDGGILSSTNADLAVGCDRILVITPSIRSQSDPFSGLDNEIQMLLPAEVVAVYADAASVAAFGSNPLSSATRPASARAGRTIGLSQAAKVATFWG